MENQEEKRIIESEGDEAEFLIEFNVPDDMLTRYATDMGIQVLHTDFVLSFFEVRLPITRGKKSAREVAEEVRTVCVSRVAISAERIPDIIALLQQRFQKFIEDRKQMSEEAKKVLAEADKL